MSRSYVMKIVNNSVMLDFWEVACLGFRVYVFNCYLKSTSIFLKVVNFERSTYSSIFFSKWQNHDWMWKWSVYVIFTLCSGSIVSTPTGYQSARTLTVNPPIGSPKNPQILVKNRVLFLPASPTWTSTENQPNGIQKNPQILEKNRFPFLPAYPPWKWRRERMHWKGSPIFGRSLRHPTQLR